MEFIKYRPRIITPIIQIEKRNSLKIIKLDKSTRILLPDGISIELDKIDIDISKTETEDINIERKSHSRDMALNTFNNILLYKK